MAKCMHEEEVRWIPPRSGFSPNVSGSWQCVTCGVITEEYEVSEEYEDGYVTRIPFPVWPVPEEAEE